MPHNEMKFANISKSNFGKFPWISSKRVYIARGIYAILDDILMMVSILISQLN